MPNGADRNDLPPATVGDRVMRNDERAAAAHLVFGIQCDLDILLLPENAEACRSDLADIVTRISRALARKEAA